MRRKLLYNVLLNIGLIVLVFCAVAAYNSQQYGILSIAVIGIVLLIYLKVRLMKQVRRWGK
jgi:hypothetical protein